MQKHMFNKLQFFTETYVYIYKIVIITPDS